VAERLVVGIGNPDRGDDAVGRLVARALRARVPADVRVVELDGEATVLLAELQSARCAWLIDAASSGAPPGTIHRIDCTAADMTLPSGGVSSHGFGVTEAIALARALAVLPLQCIVYAVEAAEFTAGAALSSEVARAVDEVAARIAAELGFPVIARSEATRQSPDRCAPDQEIAASLRSSQ
jgi:hydrogenase maturation protease